MRSAACVRARAQPADGADCSFPNGRCVRQYSIGLIVPQQHESSLANCCLCKLCNVNNLIRMSFDAENHNANWRWPQKSEQSQIGMRSACCPPYLSLEKFGAQPIFVARQRSCHRGFSPSTFRHLRFGLYAAVESFLFDCKFGFTPARHSRCRIYACAYKQQQKRDTKKRFFELNVAAQLRQSSPRARAHLILVIASATCAGARRESSASPIRCNTIHRRRVIVT